MYKEAYDTYKELTEKLSAEEMEKVSEMILDYVGDDLEKIAAIPAILAPLAGVIKTGIGKALGSKAVSTAIKTVKPYANKIKNVVKSTTANPGVNSNPNPAKKISPIRSFMKRHPKLTIAGTVGMAGAGYGIDRMNKRHESQLNS